LGTRDTANPSQTGDEVTMGGREGDFEQRRVGRGGFTFSQKLQNSRDVKNGRHQRNPERGGGENLGALEGNSKQNLKEKHQNLEEEEKPYIERGGHRGNE